MADETEKQLEATISQPAAEAVSQAGQFADAEKQATWTQVTDPYRISQKDSATMESLSDEKIDEIKAKGGFQKFELFDGTLLAEANTKDRKAAPTKAQPGEYVTVQTKDGNLKVPQGNPAFGDPTESGKNLVRLCSKDYLCRFRSGIPSQWFSQIITAAP